jgi:hypothetical protein
MIDDELALDAMKAASEHHEILMENDRVRVLDTRLASGDEWLFITIAGRPRFTDELERLPEA